MHQPEAFREDRIEVLHDFIRTHPLGLLISGGPAGLLANPVPFLVGSPDGQRTELAPTSPAPTRSGRRSPRPRTAWRSSRAPRPT